MGRNKYDKSVQDVVDEVVASIRSTPGGYTYLQNLPQQGRSSKHSLQRRWAKLIHTHALPDVLLRAMLHASLAEEGTVDKRGEPLVMWLLERVYSSPEKLFEAWLDISKVKGDV